MKFIYTLIFFFAVSTLFSQEIMTGLQIHPVIAEKARELRREKSRLAVSDTIPIAMPFFDDFSADEIFPSSERWIDRYTFVNTDFPLYPIDYGAVTLDAINDSGKIYSHAIPGPLTFIADHLTSRYIRLDSLFTPVPRAYHPSDSIYLTFYYQPQGRGLAPSASDSLVLQFLLKSVYDTILSGDTTQGQEIWHTVWSSEGMPFDTFYIRNQQYFKRVIIPITDSALYFKKYFRFRFYNYVSLTSNGQPSWQSNCDEWNIDNIYMNSGRSRGDTVQPGLRFVERPPSMLKRYVAIPYPQYSDDPTEEMTDTLSVILTNRDQNSHDAIYSYEINSPGGFTKSYTSDPITILPYFEYSFGHLIHPPVAFLFPIGVADSNIFSMRHILRDENTGSGSGDTIIGFQKFYNYYAYDDGTPEAGYGLKGTGARLAYQFKLNKSPDTLRAIRIFFNHTLSLTNQQFFYLNVWNDNNGKPGDTIYSRLVYVAFTDSLNEFITYHLENPVRISGTFYIGTEQTTDDNLNIGLDLYRNSEEYMFYNVTGSWLQSSMGGTLLMRPVIGKPLPVGIETGKAATQSVSIFPNPCQTGKVHVRIPAKESGGESSGDWQITIYELTGRKVKTGILSETTDISGLAEGIYIVEVRHSANHQFFTSKLVVLK